MAQNTIAGVGIYQIGSSFVNAFDEWGVAVDSFRVNAWNSLDELGALKGCYRLPTENNILFRSRILNVHDVNSTQQGLINNINNNLALSDYNVNDKLIYYSTENPLSYNMFGNIPLNILFDSSGDAVYDYYSPQIDIYPNLGGSTPYTIYFPVDEISYGMPEITYSGYIDSSGNIGGSGNPYSYYCNADETTVTVNFPDIGNVTWSLWKDINQGYYSIWTTNYAPQKLVLRYQIFDTTENAVFVVNESTDNPTPIAFNIGGS